MVIDLICGLSAAVDFKTEAETRAETKTTWREKRRVDHPDKRASDAHLSFRSLFKHVEQTVWFITTLYLIARLGDVTAKAAAELLRLMGGVPVNNASQHRSNNLHP